MMKKTIAIFALCFSAALWGQTVLSDFSTAPAYYGVGSWGGANAIQGGGLLTIGGSAVNDGSFFYGNSVANWSSYSAVQITGRVDAGNSATSFNFYVDTDFGMTPYAVSVSSSLFTSTLSTVLIPFALPTGFSPTAVEMWGITTEGAGSTPFRMTFDSIALTTVPEPATYAAILGFVTLGLVSYRRFRRR